MRLSKDRQVTSAVVRIGKIFSAEARADFSPVGLLVVGALVSGILLSSAVLVAAGRGRKKTKDKAGEPLVPARDELSPPAPPLLAE